MKSSLRLALVVVSCLAMSDAVLVRAAASDPAAACPLTVHEWGTFTSVAGEDGSAVDWDALGCRDDLPSFVYDPGYRNIKWGLTGTVRMETPVIYFYSDEEVDARVKVSFPHGVITEWYPRADNTVTGTMEWRNIKVQPNTSPALPVEAGRSRYYAARQTDAAPIAINDQHEKFLFYRGVGRFGVPLSVRVADNGRVLVEKRSDATVPFALYFENLGGHLRYRMLGAVSSSVSVDPPSREASFPTLRHDLEATLVAQGLFPKEAAAMVETWKDSWFEEGARVIYIVPQALIASMLPLEVEPRPAQLTRIFVGRIELFTPAVLDSVASAASTDDTAVLSRYGRFLSPILKRLEQRSPDNASALRNLRLVVDSRRCS